MVFMGSNLTVLYQANDTFAPENPFRFENLRLATRHPACLNPYSMVRVLNNRIGWQRLPMAALMVLLTLFLTLATSSDSLHKAFHGDSDKHHLPCAVCSVAQGQLDAPAIAVPVVAAPMSIAWTLPQPPKEFVRSFDFSTAPSRGPPASFASL
jgi:hypothetical protein